MIAVYVKTYKNVMKKMIWNCKCLVCHEFLISKKKSLTLEKIFMNNFFNFFFKLMKMTFFTHIFEKGVKYYKTALSRDKTIQLNRVFV